jgi:hypothetical protein
MEPFGTNERNWTAEEKLKVNHLYLLSLFSLSLFDLPNNFN